MCSRKQSIRILYVVFSVTAFSVSAAAQHSFGNTIKFTSAGFYIKGRETMSLPNRQLGVCYERKIVRNIYAGVAFQKWKNWRSGYFNKTLRVGEPIMFKPPLGVLLMREDYKIIDVYVMYKYNFKHSKHIVSGGVGGSYCWGINHYLDWYIVNPNPPYDAQVFEKERVEGYYGLFPQISYDYPLLKNRFTIGADIRGRYYIGRSPAQYDYGIHAGVNF